MVLTNRVTLNGKELTTAEARLLLRVLELIQQRERVNIHITRATRREPLELTEIPEPTRTHF